MTLMRLRVDYWAVPPWIPLFDEDVNFKSSGIWIKIDCKAEHWKLMHLLMTWEYNVPATICGTLGHLIVDEVSECPNDGNIRLFVRIKFFPFK